MGSGNFVLESQSRRWYFSTEDNNETQNDYTNISEEKLIPYWFCLPY